MLAGIFGRFGGAVPAASSASVGIAVVLLLGGWKLSQWIRANQLEEQQRVPSKNDTTTSLSRYIAMCQDQLPHVWKHEILSKILELHNEEDKEEDENGRGDEEQIIIHQVLLENPALVRTLRRRVQPFMRQRMRLLKQAQAILDQHVQSNHNKSTKTTRSIISLEDWKIWAAYHAEITVEKYRLATQTLSERLERTTDSTVSRSQLVQGLTHRLTMYCHAMNGGGGGSSDSVDDSAQGLVVLDDHVLRTFFKEALKDAILPLPQPNNDDDGEDVLHNTTMKPAATVAHLLQVVWNRTRHWIGHPILGVMTRSVQKKKREG